MSGCPKDPHKALLYRLARADQFADSTNQAVGRLWREVRDLTLLLGPPPPMAIDQRDELQKLLASVAQRWKEGIDHSAWSSIWPPKEIGRLRSIVAAGSSPKRRRKRR
jgi:hypothetical protein